jgi:hypothetical protein
MYDNTVVTTHDLWIEARQLDIDISRPSPTTIQLKITRPTKQIIVDGAVVLLSTSPLSPENYPEDGKQFLNGSLVWNQAGSDAIGDAQVVAFYSAEQGLPFPVGTLNSDGTLTSWTVTVTGTDPNTIYYASVHGTSNALQYYPLGIQSYPLDADQTLPGVGSYTGSIPELPSAPLSPTPGMVYFDQQLNLVQYWDNTRSVWIPTRTDSIISGDFNPGVPGQTYLLGGSSLKVFDGAVWVTATAANLQLRVGSGWVALATVKSSTKLPDQKNVGDVVYDYTSRRVQYWDGAAWQIPTSTSTLFSTGSSMVPAFTTPFEVEPQDLITPYVGLLFYNLKTRVLNVWNGRGWEQANTAQQGANISDKVGIGSDGTYGQRLKLVNVLKAQLGWPALCVELTEEQFNVAIDNALDTYRQLSVGAYEQRFIVYNLLPDQAVYYLNSPVDHTDAVVSVMKVHRLNLAGVTGGGPENVWGQAFAQQLYSNVGGGGDLLSSHLVSAWSEDFNKIFAGDIPFVWNEARRELFLKRSIRQHEKVILEVESERSEQELLQDRWCKQFLQNWAIAEAKEILGLIRTKYSSGTPGAAGTITLNGDTLLAEARQDFAELKQGLIDYEFNNAEHGNLSFLWG